MTKTKWILIILAIMDSMLVIMHYSDYVLLFLQPSGYIIPIVINVVLIMILLIKSKLSKAWTIVVTTAFLFITIPVILVYSLLILIHDESYTKIDNPYKNQSLIIEFRHFTKGETTYFYNFYKTRFGIFGKHLTDQEFSIMVRHYGSGIDAEGILGLGNEEWISPNAVRFPSSEGLKDVYLSSLPHSSESENIEGLIKDFMEKAKKQENGQTINVNGLQLTIRYDAKTDQEWIDVTNPDGTASIPTQQCTRISPNHEQGYYMLEECTHKWEYPLYPMSHWDEVEID